MVIYACSCDLLLAILVLETYTITDPCQNYIEQCCCWEECLMRQHVARLHVKRDDSLYLSLHCSHKLHPTFESCVSKCHPLPGLVCLRSATHGNLVIPSSITATMQHKRSALVDFSSFHAICHLSFSTFYASIFTSG